MVDRKGDDFIPLGKISKPHGIRGEVKIYPYSGSPEQFVSAYNHVYMAGPGPARLIEQRIERARVQGKQVLVKFVDCGDRTTAEQMAGKEVFVHKDDLPEPGRDEFYLHQLVGKDLVDPAGSFLGVANRVMTSGGQDLLIVNSHGREFMVPVVGAFIQSIDEDRVVLDLPPGLLEIND